jgi:hypothetical protein
VGRGKDPYPVSGPVKNLRQRCTDRAFAIGAGNVNKTQRLLRVADLVEKVPHRRKTELDFVHLEPIEMGKDLSVSHLLYVCCG